MGGTGGGGVCTHNKVGLDFGRESCADARESAHSGRRGRRSPSDGVQGAGGLTPVKKAFLLPSRASSERSCPPHVPYTPYSSALSHSGRNIPPPPPPLDRATVPVCVSVCV